MSTVELTMFSMYVMDFIAFMLCFISGTNNGLEEAFWNKKESLSHRRYHGSIFRATNMHSTSQCAISSFRNCKDCLYFSYVLESNAGTCYGYPTDLSSSYDVMPGALLFERVQPKADRCAAAGYTYASDEDLCYKFVSNTYSWENAGEACENDGSRLIILDTEPKLSLIRSVIHSSSGYSSSVYWVDGNDITTEGVWIFSTGASIAMGLEFWKTGEPNNGNRENCLCLLIRYHKFHDCTCNSNFFPICEKV